MYCLKYIHWNAIRINMLDSNYPYVTNLSGVDINIFNADTLYPLTYDGVENWINALEDDSIEIVSIWDYTTFFNDAKRQFRKDYGRFSTYQDNIVYLDEFEELMVEYEEKDSGDGNGRYDNLVTFLRYSVLPKLREFEKLHK